MNPCSIPESILARIPKGISSKLLDKFYEKYPEECLCESKQEILKKYLKKSQQGDLYESVDACGIPAMISGREFF